MTTAWEDAIRRKHMRIQPVYPMAPVRQDATPEEYAAYREAEQVERDYMEAYREHGFMHPVVEALSEYRAVTQTLHERIEWKNVHG
ncbi:hypothetical protein [Streptomyces albidoflavus]|uniref:hypothetical protein n=1 Tax=Streptomyces albidoflavus TaxID=1886 RepID=UPI0033F9E0FC